MYVRVHDLHASKLQSPNSHFTFAKVDLLNVSQQMGQSVLIASILLVCFWDALGAFGLTEFNFFGHSFMI
jgi:hypothetical protein